MSYIGIREVTRRYIGGTLVWEKDIPPVGRVFTVGTGSGDLVIDANDANAEWAGELLPDDRIRIVGGTYGDITVENVNAGGAVYVENADATAVTVTGEFTTEGYTKGLVLDFTNRQGEGLVLNPSGNNSPLVLDDNGDGHENVTIRGVLTLNCTTDIGWGWGGNAIPYDNGSGDVALKNLLIEQCRWYWDGTHAVAGGSILRLFGQLDSSNNTDNGYSDGVAIMDCVVESDSDTLQSVNMMFRNVQNLHIKGIALRNLNVSGFAHERIINLFGAQGIVENVKCTGSYGNVVRIIPINRTAGTDTSIIRNIVKSTPLKYSTVEINDVSGELDPLLPPGMEKSNVRVLGCSYIRQDGIPDPDVTCTAVDIYGSGNTSEIKDCLAVRPFFLGGATPYAWNGPVASQSDNVDVIDTDAACITDMDTLVPEPVSVFNGAGAADADLSEDLYGTARRNPPAVGAMEPAEYVPAIGGNYMDGFTAITLGNDTYTEFVELSPGVYSSTLEGGNSGTCYTHMVPVGGEIAFKAVEATPRVAFGFKRTTSISGQKSTVYGIETSSSFIRRSSSAAPGEGDNMSKSKWNGLNRWFIVQRTTLTEYTVFVSDGENRMELFTVEAPGYTDELIAVFVWVQYNRELTYPQGKGLTAV